MCRLVGRLRTRRRKLASQSASATCSFSCRVSGVEFLAGPLGADPLLLPAHLLPLFGKVPAMAEPAVQALDRIDELFGRDEVVGIRHGGSVVGYLTRMVSTSSFGFTAGSSPSEIGGDSPGASQGFINAPRASTVMVSVECFVAVSTTSAAGKRRANTGRRRSTTRPYRNGARLGRTGARAGDASAGRLQDDGLTRRLVGTPWA